MKKVCLFTASLAICSGVAVGISYSNADSNSNVSAIELANIEALSKSEGTGNTGPGQVYDCPGWFTGNGKYCLCTNNHDCTEVAC